jgi:hypothetical protein
MVSGLRLAACMAQGQNPVINIWPYRRLALLLLGLISMVACSHQPDVPSRDSTPTIPAATIGTSVARSGPSPTHALTVALIPKGTPIVVRLQSALSSTVSHPGDVFQAVLDQPIVLRGETIVPKGTGLVGEVVAAMPSASPRRPAYLRVTLSSLQIAGHNLALQTSAVFSKSRMRQPSASTNPAVLTTSETGSGQGSAPPVSREVKFSTGRQLTFWLVQPLPLQG